MQQKGLGYLGQCFSLKCPKQPMWRYSAEKFHIICLFINTHSHNPLIFDVCRRYKSKTPVVPLRMCQGVWAIFCHNWLITLLFHNHKANCLCNWQSTTLFSKFNLESLLWLRPFHTAKNRCAATCIRATVTPNRSLFGKPPGTSLTGWVTAKVPYLWSACLFTPGRCLLLYLMKQKSLWLVYTTGWFSWREKYIESFPKKPFLFRFFLFFPSHEANLVEEVEDSLDFWSGPVRSYNSPVWTQVFNRTGPVH